MIYRVSNKNYVNDISQTEYFIILCQPEANNIGGKLPLKMSDKIFFGDAPRESQ